MSFRQPYSSVNRPLPNGQNILRPSQANASRGENSLPEAVNSQVFQEHRAQLNRMVNETNAIMQRRSIRGAEANGDDNETSVLLNLLACTNLTICALLQSIDQRLEKTEAITKALFDFARIHHQDADETFAKLINFDEDTLSSLLDQLFTMASVAANDHEILSKNVRQFHDITQNQLAIHEASVELIYFGQIERFDEILKQVENLQEGQDGKLGKINTQLNAYRELQNEEYHTVMAKLGQVLDEQDGLEIMMMDKLEEVQDRYEELYEAMMGRMDDVSNRETKIINSMAKLDEAHEEQFAVAAAHMKCLISIENKLDLLGATALFTQRNNPVSGAPTELQGNMINGPRNILQRATDIPEQEPEVSVGGTFSSLLNAILPFIIVSLFLASLL